MEDTEEIKQRLDIFELIGSYLPLKKAGNNYKGLCPFHSEKTPSFMVNQERQIYKCFGCNEGGDIFSFVMKMENLTFPEALHLLADKAGVTLKSASSKSQNYGQSQPEADTKSRLYQINALSAQVFHQILTQHPSSKTARDYLKTRGIKPETIKQFRIGFAPEKTILTTFLAKRGFSVREIDTAGRPDRFRQRIMFPIFDVLGNVVGFTGRALLPDMQPKYYNTSETPLFHKSSAVYGLYQARQSIKQHNYVVLVEGQMDVILAHQIGVTNTVASSGTALTAQHLKILQRYSDNCILAFDMDAAGQKATYAAISLALASGINAKVAVLPKPYKDAGEVIVVDTQIFKKSLASAPFAMEWLIKNQLPQDQKLSAVTKKTVAKAILPYLTQITDSIEQGEWIKYLAAQIQVEEKTILEALKKLADKKSPHSANRTTEQPASAARPIAPDELLYGLLERFEQARHNYAGLYKQLQQEYTGDIKQLQAAVDDYLASIAKEDVPAEIDQLVSRHLTVDQETLKQTFARQISQAEQQGDRAQVKKLLKQLQEKIG